MNRRRVKNASSRRWSRWLRFGAAMMLGVSSIGGSWRWQQSGAAPQPFAVTELARTIDVQPNGEMRLGQTTTLSLSGVIPAADADLTRISMIHSVGLVEYRSEEWVRVVDGHAELTLPTAPLREAGQHRFTVFTDAQSGELSARIDPGPPAPGLIPIVGPSRLEADGESPVLVTVAATDEFGNAVADGTPAELVVTRPNGSEDRFVGTTTDLIAGIRVPATTDVGVVSVVAIVGGVPSEPVEFSQVAGPPARASLSAVGDQIPADGRSVIEITANEVTDVHGNLVTDGTVLRAVIDGPSGSNTLDTQIINGRAVFVVRAPSAPGDLVFQLTPRHVNSVATSDADGAPTTISLDSSDPLTIRAVPAVSSINATLSATGAVDVGPVIAPSGGFVADGTPVALLLDGVPITHGQIVNGMSQLALPAGVSVAAQSNLVVEVLGFRQGVEP